MAIKKTQNKLLIPIFTLLLFLAALQQGKAFTEDERNNIDIYQQLAPGVVNITSTVYERDFFFNVVPRQGVGSGSIIDKQGHILTNHHVIGDARELEVTLAGGEKYSARLVGSDRDTDLAVLKIDAPPRNLVVIPMGFSEKLQVGQKAIAIGNPFGLGQTLTTGVISSVRPMTLTRGSPELEIIQTDASINPGNSGGPLIDSSGKMIGINTAIFSPTGANVGIGFAIPVDMAKTVIQELIEKGYYAQPWLGASFLTLTPYLAQAFRLPVTQGVMVMDVARSSPAEQAGLRGGSTKAQVGNMIINVGGDIITKINGIESKDTDSVFREIRRHRPGTRITLDVVRWEGNRATLSVTLGERPRRR